jgi:hypothetical protein
MKATGRRKPFYVILSLIVILIFGTIFINCSKSTDSSRDWDPDVLNQPMPLELGNTWVYERLRFNGYDTILHDTVSVNVDMYKPLLGEPWAVLDGDIFNEWWSNRDEGMWIKPDSGDPFLLFKHPYPGWDNWTGNNGRYQITTRLLNCFHEIPGKGAYPKYDYSVYDTLLKSTQSYYFCPGLGIASRSTRVEEYGASRRFEKLRLIDFEINNPPVDSSGKIAFHLWVDDDNLLPEGGFSVLIGLNYVTPVCRNYAFSPEWGPYSWDGCYCPLSVDFLDSLANYTLYYEIPFVPPGDRTMIIKIQATDNNLPLAADTVNFVVDSGQTVYLGTINPFD